MKRANGEGTIYPTLRAGRRVFIAQAMVMKPDGTRGRKSKQCATQAEALKALAAMQRRQDDGLATPTGRLPTLATFGEAWANESLPAQVRLGRIREATAESYQLNWRLHVAPSLGHHRLDALTPSHVDAWLVHKSHQLSSRGRPYAPRTLQIMHGTLRVLLKHAERENLLTRNVARAASAPRNVRVEIVPLTVQQATSLIEVTRNDRLGALWLTLLSTGLRLGEALALRWDDLDFESGTLTVAQSARRRRVVSPVPGGPRTELVVSAPKTAKSAATLAMPNSLREGLQRHRAAQTKERLASPIWLDPNLVFASPHGTYLDQSNIRLRWRDALDRAQVGRHVRIHDLRHTAASFFFAQGVPLRVVSEVLRHSRLQTTADIYTHVMQELKRDAAEAMDQILGRMNQAEPWQHLQ